MHKSILFDQSILLSDVFYHRFHNVNFFSGDEGRRVVIDNDDIYPKRVRGEIGKLIGYDGKKYIS
ncbi:hypothetical protein ACMXYQ_05060 [Neptuniibacter sp. PT34_22]|uniref:hypothetical protein n=1 Tax=Neptuniibacter sp. PT34_22 TaxID=3398205 RepID=UPI0039F51B05